LVSAVISGFAAAALDVVLVIVSTSKARINYPLNDYHSNDRKLHKIESWKYQWWKRWYFSGRDVSRNVQHTWARHLIPALKRRAARTHMRAPPVVLAGCGTRCRSSWASAGSSAQKATLTPPSATALAALARLLLKTAEHRGAGLRNGRICWLAAGHRRPTAPSDERALLPRADLVEFDRIRGGIRAVLKLVKAKSIWIGALRPGNIVAPESTQIQAALQFRSNENNHDNIARPPWFLW
jgi:hypothetical protein